MDINMIDYALSYAKRGLSVFPLKVDKSPLITNGFQKATTDEVQIEAWWKRWPNANIGIATGQMSGGICIIDVDVDADNGKDGFKSMKEWEREYGSVLKPSVMAMTGRGGMHYYFHSNEEVKCRIGLLPGIDVRGDGGYVVAPPSLHPSGLRYKWREKYSIDEIEILNIDDNIRFLLQHGTSTMMSKPHYVAPDRIPNGERNAILFKIACSLQAKGYSDQAVFEATKAEMDAKCSEPLPDRELQVLVNGVLSRYAKGKPIYIDSNGEAKQGQREPIFSLTQEGKIKKTVENVREAIEFDDGLYGSIKYNVLANSIYIFGELPWEKKNTYRAWTNYDDASLKAYLEKKYGFNKTETIMDALTIVAMEHKFNPVTDELERIHEKYGKCDGSIRALLPSYMGADDSKYNYEAMKVYMLGAISRAYYPGCKFDYTLVLYGAQGFGKSEFLRRLAINSEWFNDNFNTFDGDKAIEKLNGMWIIEMAELKALKSAKDAESFKSFLTSRVDTYRAPYARRSEQRPRMCVFAGTTNNKNVFVDKTGNRRFLPIVTRKGYETKSLFGDQAKVTEDFLRAWSEAMELFASANKCPELILNADVMAMAERMQEEFSEDDYRVGVIQNWLDQTDCGKVCVPMLIEYALNRDVAKASKQEKREIMEILDNEISGWSRLSNNDRGRSYCGKYGTQIAFIKDFN